MASDKEFLILTGEYHDSTEKATGLALYFKVLVYRHNTLVEATYIHRHIGTHAMVSKKRKASQPKL
mgnify:CR=1 FL=1